jgi:hypothetical protein
MLYCTVLCSDSTLLFQGLLHEHNAKAAVAKETLPELAVAVAVAVSTVELAVLSPE